MTRDINGWLRQATGKAAGEARTVQCVTCHRGQPIPRTLTEILTETIRDQGIEAAVARYKELRKEFYGRDTYDFREDGLLALGQRLADGNPDAAIALMQMNLEFNPRSIASYIIMSRAHTWKRHKEAAIQVLLKALEIEPENGVVKATCTTSIPDASNSQTVNRSRRRARRLAAFGGRIEVVQP